MKPPCTERYARWCERSAALRPPPTRLPGMAQILCRRKAAARSNNDNFQRLNWLIRGWINYYSIGSMKVFLDEYGQWLRHKVRVVILKQWKRPTAIGRNLMKLNRIIGGGFEEARLENIANARQGWYRMAKIKEINFLLSPKILGIDAKSRPGLVDPLQYYLSSTCQTLM